MPDSLTSTNTFIFSIGKIKTITQLRSALRHNKREIQKELGARSHIDSLRIPLNYSLLEDHPTIELVDKVNAQIKAYQTHTRKGIRCDAVLAIELLFSIPAAKTDIDSRAFFEDCLAWAKEQFSPAEVLTAHVHLDEANPHMHLILLCVTPTKLLGSFLKGSKLKYKERADNFFQEVANKHGLQKPAFKLKKAERHSLAKQVISHVETCSDPVTTSALYPLIRQSIEFDPTPFAMNLGIEIHTAPPKLKTMTQIMTSKGKGPRWQPPDEIYPV